MSRPKILISISSSLILSAALAASLTAAACKSDPKPADESPNKPVEQTEAPVDVEQKRLGVESPRALGYVWGKGAKDFKAAEKLLKEEARDWQAIAAACKAALAEDSSHFGAHRLLGIALANSGKPEDGAEAADHLSTALAADWLRWGPTLADDKSLTDFLKTEAGKGLLAQNDKYKARFYELADAAVLVVARRTGWSRPKKPGKQWAATRGELFAYSLEDERYLRLTHTGESLVGFVRSPSGDRIATLAVTHYEFGEAPVSPISAASVAVLDAKSFVQIGETARLKKTAPALALYYGAGEELFLDAAGTVYSVDFEGGKLKPSRDKGIGEWAALYDNGMRARTVLYATSELARVLEPWGVSKASGKSITVAAGGSETEITLPDAGGQLIRRVSWSPDKARLTIVGVGDSCKDDHQSTLYVADAKTGALKHVHRGAGLMGARWLDDSRFIFEAEPGELRVYDAASNNTTYAIKNRYGIVLSAISNARAGEHCATVPAAAPASDSDPMEQEDGEVEAGEAGSE